MVKTSDTSKLKKMIADKGFDTTIEFCKKIADLTGDNAYTIKGHMNGYGIINNDEIAAAAMLLNIKEGEVRSLIVPVGNSAKKEEKADEKKNERKEVKAAETGISVPEAPYIISYVNLDRARLRSGITQTQIINAMKASGSRWTWGTVRVSKEDADKLTKILSEDFDMLFEYRPVKATAENSAYYTAKKELDGHAKKRGISPEKIEKTIGAAKGTYEGWLSGKPVKPTHAMAVAKILGVRLTDIFEPAWDKTKVAVKTAKSVPKAPKLDSVDGMLQVFDIFGVINKNMQTVADYMTTLDDKAAERQDELNALVKKDIAALSSKLDGIEKSMSLILEKLEDVHKNDNTKIVQIDSKKSQLKRKNPAVSSEPVNSTFSLTDDLEHYVKKINSMAQHIASSTGQTRDDVLHMFYTEMNRTYGVVYDQLKKEYKANHGSSQTWSMALLYDNTLFREIFFHIVQAKYEDVYTQKENRS